MPDSVDAPMTCFVIMPITDAAPYEPGHFRRVYDHIIKPACAKAGFTPVRADEVERSNHIILDVLRRILQADAVLCDLSSRNPNVMYELGVRQAFNKPVVLIKDSQTERVFDIQGLRDIEYDAALRVDKIGSSVSSIAASLTNTTDGDQDEVNSLIQLLGVQAATIPQRTEISGETSLILRYLNDIASRLSTLERVNAPAKAGAGDFDDFPGIFRYSVGEAVTHSRHGDGTVSAIDTAEGTVRVKFNDGKTRVVKVSDSELTEDLPF